MKLSAETKAELQALDFEYGGGVSTSSTRTDVIDKPILIVSLGGTGAEALIRVKKAISGHFKLGTSLSGRKMDKPPQVEYMAIDSDDNMVNLNYSNTTFSQDEFLLLDNANLTSIYKNRDTVFKNSTQNWIASNLRLQQVKHGAGGIRQAGRLLLTINSNRVIGMLTEKINRLTTNRKSNDLLYVFIMAGCAGGTGSGIFIDVPYIIRKIAEQRGFETENIGMIFLPDVTLSDSMIDGSAALNIKANGFAALKELDYLMNIERNGDFFEQTYADLEIKTEHPPYDLCHLVSAKDEQGKLVSSAKNYCMNVAAETIINFIASEEVIDGQSYTISSYLSNIENNKAAFIMTHQQKQPVNYIYNTVGAASASLPMEYLLNYLTWKMFSELDSITGNSPILENTKLTLESFRIDLQSLERALGEDKPKPRNFSQYDYTVLQQRPEIVEDAVKNELSRLKDYYNGKVTDIINSFSSTLDDANNVLYQHFSDLEKGPYYTLRELSDLHEASLLRAIDTIRKRDIQHKREHRDSIQAIELNRQAATEKLRKKSLLPVGKKSQATHIVELNEEYLRLVSRNVMYDAIDTIYESIVEKLNNFYETIDTYCELLSTFRELFAKFKNKQNSQSDNFALDLVTIKDFCETFESDSETAKTLDYKLALKRLLRDMLTNSTWTPGLNNKIVENLNIFVAHQFQTVLHKSLDYYSVMMANATEQGIEDYIGDKINALHDIAKVMFPINHIPSGLHITFPPYAYLSVPSNSPQIRAVVGQMSTAGKVSNIKYSRMNNRLYMLNLKIAVALYCYKELNEYESVYEASLNKLSGIHLYESSLRNWKNLPSPNYDKLWTTGYENPRERAKNNRLRELFDQALHYGIIRLDENSRNYIVFYGKIIDLTTRFSHIEDAINDRTMSAQQARAAMSELNSFMTDERERRDTNKMPLFDTEFLHDTDEPDNDYAKGVFIYMPILCEKVAHEVNIRQYIEKLQSELLKIDRAEIKYSHFAQLFYMGVISRNRKTYRYTIEGVTHILYTMQNIAEQYVEYDLFQAYLDLDESTALYLQKRARDEENRLDDDQLPDLARVIGSYTEAFEKKLKQLEAGFFDEREGALKKVFYREMLEIFKQEMKVLS